MRILVDLLHPADAHFYRPFVAVMRERGHEVRLLSRRKDVLCDLLDAWDMEHYCVSNQARGNVGLGLELAARTAAILRHTVEFRPHVMTGVMGPGLAMSRPLVNVPAVVFYDNETTARLNAMVARLCDAWISPRGYGLCHGARHLRYAGYHETAYLHPHRFTPQKARVRAAGIDPDRPYSIVRFVGWDSIHDRGESGFSEDGKRRLVETLARLGPVWITSEKPLPADYEPYRLSLPVDDLHHALAFARLFVGESSTMASEAACLGTTAAFVSTSGRGVNNEQTERYQHVATFHGNRERDALAWVEAAIVDPDLNAKAADGHARLLADTVDVTGFMVDFFETRFG